MGIKRPKHSPRSRQAWLRVFYACEPAASNRRKEAHDLLLGRRYNRTKKTFTEAGAKGGASLGQNDPGLSTAAKLAVEHGVSEATVKRAGQFAEAVEAQGLEAEAMSGKLKGKKKEVVEAHRKATGASITIPPPSIASAPAKHFNLIAILGANESEHAFQETGARHRAC